MWATFRTSPRNFAGLLGATRTVLWALFCTLLTASMLLTTQVAEQTHSLILASGTLAPLGLLQRQLFPHYPLTQLHTFTCGHVVPASRLLLLPFTSGPSGLALDLKHATRSQPSVMDELGRLMLNVCQAVPQVMIE